MKLMMCITNGILAASMTFAQRVPRKNWTSFKSSAGFSVDYPANWIRKGVSTDRLMILSSHGGAEAVVIERGQAMIWVAEEKKYVGSNLAAVIDHYIQGVSVISRSSIHNENAGATGCRDLLEIRSEEASVPRQDVPDGVPYLVNTEYFCQVGPRIYVTVLRNFDGDKKQALYRHIALSVAESLRAGN